MNQCPSYSVNCIQCPNHYANCTCEKNRYPYIVASDCTELAEEQKQELLEIQHTYKETKI